LADTEQIVGKTRGERRQITCQHCDRLTNHGVVESVNTTRVLGGRFTITNDYEVVQCNGCDHISFRHYARVIATADGPDKQEELLGDDQYLYPPHVAGRRKLSNDYHLPERVRRIYGETHEALCSQQHVLAGIGIRALIEAVCQEKKAAGTTLERRIDSLVSAGVLTAAGASILHRLRAMGNTAAHEVEPHSPEDLSVAFDVVEHLLEGVYLLPKKAEQFGKKSS
jgi:hypothetical protein